MTITFPERSGHAAPPQVLQLREYTATRFADRPDAAGVRVSELDLNGVPALEFEPPDPRLTILYFHGGGYRGGSPRGLSPYLSGLASLTSTRVVAVAYRLAPENPYPAALNDALTAWASLRTADPSRELVVAGDSAGGGLATSLMVTLRTRGGSLPAGAVLLCPWVDLRLVAASFEECAEDDQIYSLELARDATDMYLQGHAADDPRLSTVLADWTGMPPLLIQASSHEVLRDDARTLATAAIASGVRVWFSEFPGLRHVWQNDYPLTPESVVAIEQVRAFLENALDRSASAA